MSAPQSDNDKNGNSECIHKICPESGQKLWLVKKSNFTFFHLLFMYDRQEAKDEKGQM